MNALKSVLLTLILLCLALTGYIFYKFDSNYFLSAVAKAYAKEDYESAQKLLSSFKKKVPARAHLYQGYILRAQSRPSNTAFQKAHDGALEPQLRAEASFNLLLNAYLDQNYAFIEKHLDEQDDSAIGAFFAALLHYQEKDFERAYHCFLHAEAREYTSPFMQQEWNRHFPKLFEVTRKAHCLIEIGKPALGRQLLENSLKQFEDVDHQLSKLLGWTYLKESSSRPLTDALAYFEQAKPYFVDLSTIEREKLKDWLMNAFNSMHKEAYYEPLTPLLGFASELGLVDEVMTYLALQAFEKQGHSLDVPSFIHTYDQLSRIPEVGCALKEEALLENYLAEVIEYDDESLEDTYELLLFWDRLERDDHKRLAMLESLFPLVKTLWSENTIKALQLSKYLDQFSHKDQKPLVQQTVLEILQEVCAEGQTKEEQEAYLYFNPLFMR